MGINSFQNPIAAYCQPVHLAPWHHDPQGQPARVSADVNRIPIAAGDGANISFPAVGEIVNVVPRYEVQCVQVGAVDGELI